MRFRGKAALLLATAGLLLGAGAGAATAAYAGTGNEWCITAGGAKCINAWSGGPFVKLYTGVGGGANSDFDLFSSGNGHVVLRFTGNSGWAGNCVGDASNDPNQASTSLDQCDISGQHFGWGTLFDPASGSCPVNRVALRNVRWGGYLGPQDQNTNGSPFYLNKPTPWCFLLFPPE